LKVENFSMKKLLLGALCATCGASAVHAQSSVTLYGLMDVGITSVSNQGGSRDISLATGMLSPNLFGITGVDDLGGGLKAIFKLEGQFEMGTGALDGTEFGRQSWVGLESVSWGALTAGNQYDYMFTSLSKNRLGPELPLVSMNNLRQGPFAALGKPLVPTGDFDFDRTAGAQRLNNSLRYQSASIDGLTVGGMYEFGGVAGSLGNSSAYSFGADFIKGTYSIDAAYTMVKYAAINNGNSGIRNFGFGGRIAVLDGWADVLYTNTLNTFTGAQINVFEVGGTYPLTTFASIGVSYDYMKGNQVLDGNKANQFNLTLDYGLSKSTDVYLSAVYQRASGDPATAQAWIIGTGAASSDGNQTLVRVGMRHLF
jgi:predicted porin